MASLAARFETDVETVEACMMEAQTSIGKLIKKLKTDLELLLSLK